MSKGYRSYELSVHMSKEFLVSLSKYVALEESSKFPTHFFEL
jgi:hypothetical protein